MNSIDGHVWTPLALKLTPQQRVQNNEILYDSRGMEFFVMNCSAQMADFDIEPSNFFASSTKLKIFVGRLSMSRCCPITLSNISARMVQQIKFAKETIVSNVFPRYLLLQWI